MYKTTMKSITNYIVVFLLLNKSRENALDIIIDASQRNGWGDSKLQVFWLYKQLYQRAKRFRLVDYLYNMDGYPLD